VSKFGVGLVGPQHYKIGPGALFPVEQGRFKVNGVRLRQVPLEGVEQLPLSICLFISSTTSARNDRLRSAISAKASKADTCTILL